MTPLPMPGDKWDDKIVVASGTVTDDVYGLLLIVPNQPGRYYQVVEYEAEFDAITFAMAYENIVPAAAAFHEQFGFWGD